MTASGKKRRIKSLRVIGMRVIVLDFSQRNSNEAFLYFLVRFFFSI